MTDPGQGPFDEPAFGQDYEAEKALSAVIQEAFVHGVSTRSVDDLVQAMGMSGISKSQASRLCGEIDDKIKAFLERLRYCPRLGSRAASRSGPTAYWSG
jgi:transposase-like protein